MDKHWGRWLFFEIQTNTHRKLLSLVCSEGPSSWRLGTARQAIWMNVSPWGGLGSRVGTGLEAGVSLTALLKGGGLRHIHPGLSLSVSLGGNWACDNAGGKSMRVSENSSNFTHPSSCPRPWWWQQPHHRTFAIPAWNPVPRAPSPEMRPRGLKGETPPCLAPLGTLSLQ